MAASLYYCCKHGVYGYYILPICHNIQKKTNFNIVLQKRNIEYVFCFFHWFLCIYNQDWAWFVLTLLYIYLDESRFSLIIYSLKIQLNSENSYGYNLCQAFVPQNCFLQSLIRYSISLNCKMNIWNRRIIPGLTISNTTRE